ncbi:Coronin-like protein crn1 [Elasticomyces elasticus]|nr:Coronin-like protein crn1 [Elasticomyces elasticus]KAK4985333.1 Coronin-like protein crn1 [Elasticomyces elasticus]
MSGRFVRNSKYRHVFGRSAKKEQCYDNLRISNNAWDTNLVKANPKYISVNWQASGGGAFAVIPLDERGKLPEHLPLFRGHTAAVLDTDWSPFDDSLIASGSDDGKVFVWQVPEGFTLHTDGDESHDVEPVGKLMGHSRKVGHVLFNPSAENVLASASGDFTIKIWDLQDGKSKLSLKHNDIVQSLSWSADGSMLVTTSRDKKLRFWDVRQQRPAHEVSGHSGAKNSRVVWMGEHDRVATTGFSRMSDRQLGLWDTRNPTKAISIEDLDQTAGVCMPFWDEGTQMLYLAGKGDGNIRYYEYENDKFQYLSEYKSGEPQRGIAFLPKRGVNTHENEVARAYKTTHDTMVEPISFIVPRRAEVFQDDIYPPTVGSKPAMSAGDWFGGKEGLPPKISLESLYEGEEPVEISADSVPKPTRTETAPAPAPAAAVAKPVPREETPKPTPAATTSRGPPPSVKDNKESMSAMASKFADDDDEGSSDETSSFEEVQKPVERPSVALRQEQKTGVRTPPHVQKDPSPPPTKTSSAFSAPEPESEPEPELQPRGTLSGQSLSSSNTTSTPAPEPRKSETSASSSATAPTPTAAAAGLKDHLLDIKSLLQRQAEQIADLTREVGELKARLGEGGHQ